MRTVLISGLGDLGGWALELLARADGVDRIVTIKRSRETGVPRTHLARIGSVFQGHTKAFDHHHLDLTDVDATARLLAEVRPDVILNAAAGRSPRALMTASVDPEHRRLLREARFGVWVPWHILPVARLTEAIEKAGIAAHVVSIAFPDVVNPAVWRRYGHGPATGAGNLEISAATIERYVADDLEVDLDDVELDLVGSHAFMVHGPEVPHFFRVRVGGEDVTRRYDLGYMIKEWPVPIEWGKTTVFSAFAASAVKNVLGIIRDEGLRTHVSAPAGLPGGYPARLSASGAEVLVPDGLSLDDAIDINERANAWSGIDRIEDDGTVVYAARTNEIMSHFGYTAQEVTFDALEARASELHDLYRRLTDQNKR